VQLPVRPPTKAIAMIVNLPRSTFLFLLAISLLLMGCSKKNDTTPTLTADPIKDVLNLPATAFNYSNLIQPAYLNGSDIQSQINTPAGNTITDNGATLGRVLFYDKNLSINNSISCASCHKQNNAFSDPVTRSAGFAGGLTGRNSMTLIDAKYYPDGRFFWDQRANSLESQVLIPIQNMVEMGMTLPQLEIKLKAFAYYPLLFEKAFGDNVINSNRISLALSQFVRSIVSYQSKYDAGRSTFPAVPAPAPTTLFPNFTVQENRGKEIFLSPQFACAACHGSETFTAIAARNNGLDLITTDRGFGQVTNDIANDGRFKSGTLRNVELTAPYMHDGRFATLEQVVEHYSSGVKDHPNLSPQLRLPNGQPRLANFSPQDKAALVAFLKTLTDNTVTTDVKYSNPFK